MVTLRPHLWFANNDALEAAQFYAEHHIDQLARVVDELGIDVYAFGLSAFEILTCRRPFPVSSDRSRRMQNRLNTEPLKLRQVDPGLSERLEAIIGKCIEKDREMRYKSMLEVMRHLRAAVEAASSGSG